MNHIVFYNSEQIPKSIGEASDIEQLEQAFDATAVMVASLNAVADRRIHLVLLVDKGDEAKGLPQMSVIYVTEEVSNDSFSYALTIARKWLKGEKVQL